MKIMLYRVKENSKLRDKTLTEKEKKKYRDWVKKKGTKPNRRPSDKKKKG